MMSGTMIIAILLTITPFIFPVVMTLPAAYGMCRPYFSILAASTLQRQRTARKPVPCQPGRNKT